MLNLLRFVWHHMGWFVLLALAFLAIKSAWRMARADKGRRARVVRRELGLLAIFYLGLVVVLSLLESTFLYHPHRPEQGWLSPGEVKVQDVWLHAETGERIHAWWCPVESPEWVLLYCHGNAGNLSYRRELIRRWQHELNASVLIFDYPGFGKSEGKPTERGCYAAAHAAYDWLIGEQRVRPERLLLYGKSLGGAMAAELAVDRPHAALILQSTFTSLPDLAQQTFPFLPARWLTRSRYDTLARLRSFTGPLFVAHGDGDGLIPFTHAERLFAESASETKDFCCLNGCGHDDVATPECYGKVRAFVQRLR